MRILLLSHAFNSLSQRLWLSLSAAGYALSVEFDINDAATRQAVALWRPEVVIAPYLKRAIPEYVWRSVPCLNVRTGDRKVVVAGKGVAVRVYLGGLRTNT